MSRRSFLRNSAVMAALGGTGLATAVATAQPASAASSFVPADPALHLLRRTTWGLTPGIVKQIRALGSNEWLNRQLAPNGIDDDYCEDLIAQRFPRVLWSIDGAVNGLDEEFSWDLMFDLGAATIARACWSKRQLFEVMVDFWANHLNVTNPSDSVWATRHDYENKVLRAHALGKFSNMLRASATHPAMMTYLNNADSSKWQPNENYGRELLELHSVGVDGGYTETDMRHSTLIMTGFGIDWDTYEFKYRGSWHHTGMVQVMSFSHANPTGTGGYDVGLAYVDHLAHHPSTAAYIAAKLVRRFVSDDPDPALVASLASTFLANDTAIVPVLRQLFASPQFASSAGVKTRRPLESMVATIRALGIKPDINGSKGMRELYWMVSDLGQPPAAWPQPNGYPDYADAWRSGGGTLARWNSNMSLAAHWWPKALVLPPLRKLLPRELPTRYGKFIDLLSVRLLQTSMSATHRDAVLGFLGVTETTRLRPSDDALGWRLPYVVSLILDSPYHQVR